MTRPAGSTAVMARRASAPDELDYFPTPPWAVRGFCEWLYKRGETPRHQTCWEPACGEGHMAQALAEHFGQVHASDIFPYGFGEVRDFLPQPLFDAPEPERAYGWIITNPPFTKALEFAEVALSARAKAWRCCCVPPGWKATSAGASCSRPHVAPHAGSNRWSASRWSRIGLIPMRARPPHMVGRFGSLIAVAVLFSTGTEMSGRSSNGSPCRARLERAEDYR